MTSFLSDARRVSKPEYLPSTDDVLHARLKTTGISETYFLMGQLNVQYVLVRRSSFMHGGR